MQREDVQSWMWLLWTEGVESFSTQYGGCVFVSRNFFEDKNHYKLIICLHIHHIISENFSFTIEKQIPWDDGVLHFPPLQRHRWITFELVLDHLCLLELMESGKKSFGNTCWILVSLDFSEWCISRFWWGSTSEWCFENIIFVGVVGVFFLSFPV